MSKEGWTSSTGRPLTSSSRVSLEALPTELLLHILSFLDARSFNCFRSVNTQFRRLANSATPQLSTFQLELVIGLTNKTWAIARELFNHIPDSNPASEDISLLMQTLIDIDKYFRLVNRSSAFGNIKNFVKLCGIMLNHLREAAQFTQDLIYGKCELGQNFAMLDLCLRKNYREIRAMFPALEASASSSRPAPLLALPAYIPARGASSSGYEEPNRPAYQSPANVDEPVCPEMLLKNPTLLIGDEAARSAWSAAFGMECVVDFDTFFSKVILAYWPNALDNPDFENHFRFSTNFPRDNWMTTYKWDSIIKQFGPFNHFYDNFCQFGCGNGFLGLVNSVKADEILRKRSHLFLLRISRLEPERLTLSFCTKSSSGFKVFHRRKPHDLSLPQFLHKFLFSKSRFRPVPDRLDSSVSTSMSFPEFIRSSQSFIHSNQVERRGEES